MFFWFYRACCRVPLPPLLTFPSFSVPLYRAFYRRRYLCICTLHKPTRLIPRINEPPITGGPLIALEIWYTRLTGINYRDLDEQINRDWTCESWPVVGLDLGPWGQSSTPNGRGPHWHPMPSLTGRRQAALAAFERKIYHKGNLEDEAQLRTRGPGWMEKAIAQMVRATPTDAEEPGFDSPSSLQGAQIYPWWYEYQEEASLKHVTTQKRDKDITETHTQTSKNNKK